MKVEKLQTRKGWLVVSKSGWFFMGYNTNIHTFHISAGKARFWFDSPVRTAR